MSAGRRGALRRPSGTGRGRKAEAAAPSCGRSGYCGLTALFPDEDSCFGPAGSGNRVRGRSELPGGGMAVPSRVLAWRTPWTEEPGGLQSVGSQGAGHDCVTQTRTVRPHRLPASLPAPSVSTCLGVGVPWGPCVASAFPPGKFVSAHDTCVLTTPNASSHPGTSDPAQTHSASQENTVPAASHRLSGGSRAPGRRLSSCGAPA